MKKKIKNYTKLILKAITQKENWLNNPELNPLSIDYVQGYYDSLRQTLFDLESFLEEEDNERK